MEFGQILKVLLIIFFPFMIVSQGIFWRNRKKARENIITDWKKFLKAENSDDIELIKKYAEKLIWNRYVSQDQIDKLNESLSSRLNDHPELSSLYDVTKNRRSYLNDDEKEQIYGE